MRRTTVWAVLLLLLFGAGCGRGPAHKAVYPVRGQVLYKGKPAEGILVYFVPVNPQEKYELPSIPLAVTAANGSFALGTYGKADGAPASEYAVSLFWPETPYPGYGDPGPDRLGGRYSDWQTSRWRVTVQPEPNAVPPFELD
jgi:hypothetical protein